MRLETNQSVWTCLLNAGQALQVSSQRNGKPAAVVYDLKVSRGHGDYPGFFVIPGLSSDGNGAMVVPKILPPDRPGASINGGGGGILH